MIWQWEVQKNRQGGAAIVVIIAAMTIVAILGAGMLSLFSSSTFSELFINNRTKAYYLAQAGRQYATMIITQQNNSGHPELIDGLLKNKTFTVNGGAFYLYTTTTIDNTTVESTGIVNEGSALETKQKIRFIIPGVKFGQGVNACYDYQGIYYLSDGGDRGGTIGIFSNGYIDSYDSALGAYDIQPRGTSATVKTNGGGTLSGPGTFISLYKNAMIYGNAICGAGGNPDTAISAGVGKITGTRTAASADVLPSAVLPNELDPSDPGCQCADPTGITCNWSGCGPEANYIGNWVKVGNNNSAYKSLTGQSPQIGSTISNPIVGETDPNKRAIIYTTNKINLTTGSKLYFQGKVVLIVYYNSFSGTGQVSMSNASEIVILPGGSLDLYVESDANFASGSIVNQPPSPSTVMKVVGIRTANISFASTKIYSLMYGPGATCNVADTGLLYGSITARKISVIGAVHLDVAASSTKREGVVY
ncbi:MAG: hypothetical protein AB2L12_15380 [Smithellaceae bacterium]